MYSTCGLPVLLNIGKTSFSVSLKTKQNTKRKEKHKHKKHDLNLQTQSQSVNGGAELGEQQLSILTQISKTSKLSI